MTRYGMAIDLNRCFGCQTCAVACKMANNLPNDVLFNQVKTVGGDSVDTAAGEYPNCTLSYLPFQCQHCEKPACLEVCPTGATTKDEETGIVSVDSELCIGCESCIKACPYEGVRTLIKSPEYYLDVVVGELRRTRAARWRSARSARTSSTAATCPHACSCARAARATGATWTIPSRTCRRPSRGARRCSSTRKPARNRAFTTCSNKALTA